MRLLKRLSLAMMVALALTVVYVPKGCAESPTYNAANPWVLDGSGSTPPYFSSLAEVAIYLIDIDEAAGSEVHLTGYQGPFTTDSGNVACSTTNPCWQVDLAYSDGSWAGGYQVQYVGKAAIGQNCPDGSYAPVGQACVGQTTGNSTCNCSSTGGVQVGNPIDVGSGNKFEQAVDYGTEGANKLAFVRYYNSRASFTTPAAMLGMFWRSEYDRYIRIVSSTSVIAERADGQQLSFTLTNARWTPDSDVDLTLTQSGSAWTLTDKDDRVETYTTGSAGAALLNTIQSRNGYTQTLTYSGNQVSSVTDSYGRSLVFTYNSSGLLSAITTPDGTTISYSYTAVSNGSNLTSVTYPTSPATSRTYLYENSSLPNALTGIVDENGNRYATWSYDVFGRGITSSHGGLLNADLTTLTYNDTNGSRTVTNALGVTDTYTFTTLQGVPKVTQISRAGTATTAAASESFTYDSNGYLASMTDWNGNQTQYTNNIHGLPTQVVEASGSSVARTTAIAYDATWVHLPHSVMTPGLTVTSTYDTTGELLTRTYTDTTATTSPYSTNGQARTWTYTWSNYLLTSIKTPRSYTTALGYDASGALTSVTDALGHVTHITSHTNGGLPLTVVDPNNVTTTLAYNKRQWLLSRSIATSGGALTTSYAYDAAGNLTQTMLPDGSYINNSFDAAHRLIGTSDALNNVVTYKLDALGNKILSEAFTPSGANSWQHFSNFDQLGRMLTDFGGVGQSTTYTYDPNGNALTVKDGLNHTINRVFDALNRLHQSTDANGGVALYAYNPHNKLLSVTDPNSNTTSWVRDGFDEPIQQLSPDSGTTVYRFDSEGNLTQKLDAAGITTNQTFDALNRLLTLAYPADGAENVAYVYDEAGHGFGIGRLTSLTDAAGSLSRNYDERGNMLSEKRTAGTKGYPTTYSYTPASLVASITYPSGSLVSYTRDAAERITSIATQAPSFSAVNLATNITYAPFGPVTGTKAFNGDAEAFTFDADYRMRTLITTAANAPQNLTFGYDAANNVTGVADSVCPVCSGTYYYDLLNRLEMAEGWYGQYSYWEDKNGNLLGDGLENGQNLYPGFYSYQPGTNRLSSIYVSGFSYPVSTNPNGNITSFTRIPGETTTLTYNNANRLATSATPWQAASYAYDGFGKRFSKTDAGSPTTLYFHDLDGNLIEEVDNGTPNDYLWLNDRPIGTLTPSTNTLSFIHVDRLDNPITATDKNARLAWMARYMPYGGTGVINVQGGAAYVTQNIRLPGQLFDPETMMNHNGWRDLSPALGRYVEADPIGLRGGLNTYSYAAANPLNRIDPSGEDLRVYTFYYYHYFVVIDVGNNQQQSFEFSPISNGLEPFSLIGPVPGHITSEPSGENDTYIPGQDVVLSNETGKALANQLNLLENQWFTYSAGALFGGDNCASFVTKVRNLAIQYQQYYAPAK